MKLLKNRIIIPLVVIPLFIVLALGGVGIYSISYMQRISQAYIYGFPLVLMELTRQTMMKGVSNPGQLRHVRSFPDHTFRNVVRPNNDTLYSIAWLDLSKEALVLAVPEIDDRYYVIPFMDAWTNVFSSIGTRTQKTGAGEYLITGPDWGGATPANLKTIESPTNMVWIIGRIQTNSRTDIKNVSSLQDKFTLTPLKRWLNGEVDYGVVAKINSNTSKRDIPQQLMELTGAKYFNLLAELLGKQRPSSSDGEAISVLKELGVTPGRNFQSRSLSSFNNLLMEKAIELTLQELRSQIDTGRQLENGWAVKRDLIGDYGDNYALRAAVAMIGLGALSPAEMAYPNTRVDAQNNPLSGKFSYVLKFAAGKTPPVDAFWSLTMYDKEGFLVDNPIGRYAIGDRDILNFNKDGSLEIVIQHGKPSADNANWLPTPKGGFELTLRLMSPKETFLNGTWSLPPVEKQSQ